MPNTLEHLIFGYKYNTPIKSKLPNSLKILVFGYNFNQSIENILPDSLEKLVLGNQFNKPLGNIIYEKTTLNNILKLFIKVPNEIIEIDKYLPESLTSLTIGFNTKYESLLIPSNVNHLVLQSYQKNISKIPKSVVHLELGWFSDCPDNIIKEILTSNIKKLN